MKTFGLQRRIGTYLLRTCLVVACVLGQALETNLLLAQVTVSITDGDWNNPSVWDNGVPNDSTRAIIRKGTTVNLGGLDHAADGLVIHGTLNVPEGISETASLAQSIISSPRSGVAVSDNATGDGYFLRTLQNVRARFGIRPDANNNVVAVRFFNGGWQYNDDSGWVGFNPRNSDRLIAEVDFTDDTVVSLQGTIGRINGIDSGFLASNLTFEANVFNGSSDPGEFFVGGGTFSLPGSANLQLREILNSQGAVLVAPDASGEGYLLHSLENVGSRLGLAGAANSNVVAVRFAPEQGPENWQFNDGSRWVDFTPLNTDRLIAAVNFNEYTTTSLKGSASVVEGIQAGFLVGDVSFQTDALAGVDEPGAFFVDGDSFYVTPPVTEAALEIDKRLTCRWIHVNSDGRFQIGSASHRYDDGTFVVTLTGTDPTQTVEVEMEGCGCGCMGSCTISNNDGFLMAAGGGRFQFFGQQRLSFTKLAATAEAGSSTIVVANVIERNFDGVTSVESDGQVDWEVGDEIVIASSTLDYAEEDVRVITDIQQSDAESIITLNQPLSFRHYGEIEEYARNFAPGTPTSEPDQIDLRAEVALLSRNVMVQGLESQDTDIQFGDRELLDTFSSGGRLRTRNGVSGHMMIMNGAGQTTVDGVQLDLLGQGGRLGRYPIHWHFSGNRSGDLLRNVSITNSNNRGVVVHGADNVRIEGVVLHDIHGHGFFLESAVENGNQFIANIAFGVHRVGTRFDLNDPFIVDFHDRTRTATGQFNSSSSFWITNADNVFIGNISAGSQGSGYWFGHTPSAVNVPSATPDVAALNRDPNLRAIFDRGPLEATIGTFRNNSVHSTDVGLVFGQINNLNETQTDKIFGGNEDQIDIAGLVEDFTVHKTNTGFYARTDESFIKFENYRAADNAISFWDTTPGEINGGLFVGQSRGNSQSTGRRASVAFFKYFDQINLEDIHFAGFGVRIHNQAPFVFRDGGAINQFDTTVAGISFEDQPTALTMRNITGGATSIPTLRPIFDFDGSLTGHIGGGPGFSLIRHAPFWFDENDGDVALTSGAIGRFTTAITQKRFIGFHLTGAISAIENVRLRVTSPTGVEYEFGGVAADEPLNSAGNRPFINNPRFPAVAGEEYVIDPVRPYDLSNQKFEFSYQEWSALEGTFSNVFHLRGGAGDLFTPTFSQTGFALPAVSDVDALRNATQTSYFADSNGDLWLKLFSTTEDESGSIDRNVFRMVQRGTAAVAPPEADPPALGPLVITELNYRPENPSAALAADGTLVDNDLEYVEITNPTTEAIDLTNWRLRDEVNYDFTAGTSLAAGEALIVVSFDPLVENNTSTLAAFRAHYNLPPSVTIIGGYLSSLANTGGRIELQRPETTGSTTRVTADEVVYNNLAAADGTGQTLERVDLEVSGTLASNWIAAAPTPGLVKGAFLLGDANLNGVVNFLDISAFILILQNGAFVDQADINRDGVVNFLDIGEFITLLAAA